AAVIGNHGRREESGHLEPAVTVRRPHHGNLDAHVAQSGDVIGPVSFHWGAPLELEAKFGEELNGGINVFHHDADVVHTLDRHDVPLPGEPTAPSAACSCRACHFMIRTQFLTGSSMSLMFSIGLPSTTSRSANAPSSTTPSLPGYGLRFPDRASSWALVPVAMTSASAGLYQRTSLVSNSP